MRRLLFSPVPRSGLRGAPKVALGWQQRPWTLVGFVALIATLALTADLIWELGYRYSSIRSVMIWPTDGFAVGACLALMVTARRRDRIDGFVAAWVGAGLLLPLLLGLRARLGHPVGVAPPLGPTVADHVIVAVATMLFTIGIVLIVWRRVAPVVDARDLSVGMAWGAAVVLVQGLLLFDQLPWPHLGFIAVAAWGGAFAARVGPGAALRVPLMPALGGALWGGSELLWRALRIGDGVTTPSGLEFGLCLLCTAVWVPPVRASDRMTLIPSDHPIHDWEPEE